jgi:hypothetical protein
MVDITIVNGVYKPTYNWGAPSCRDKRTHCAQLGHRITTERNSDYTACPVPEAGGVKSVYNPMVEKTKHQKPGTYPLVN